MAFWTRGAGRGPCTEPAGVHHPGPDAALPIGDDGTLRVAPASPAGREASPTVRVEGGATMAVQVADGKVVAGGPTRAVAGRAHRLERAPTPTAARAPAADRRAQDHREPAGPGGDRPARARGRMSQARVRRSGRGARRRGPSLRAPASPSSTASGPRPSGGQPAPAPASCAAAARPATPAPRDGGRRSSGRCGRRRASAQTA